MSDTLDRIVPEAGPNGEALYRHDAEGMFVCCAMCAYSRLDFLGTYLGGLQRYTTTNAHTIYSLTQIDHPLPISAFSYSTSTPLTHSSLTHSPTHLLTCSLTHISHHVIPLPQSFQLTQYNLSPTSLLNSFLQYNNKQQTNNLKRPRRPPSPRQISPHRSERDNPNPGRKAGRLPTHPHLQPPLLLSCSFND